MTSSAMFRGGGAGFAAALSLVWITPAAAQAIGQASEVEVSPWRIAAALVLCLALAVAGAFAIKVKTDGRLPQMWGLRRGRSLSDFGSVLKAQLQSSTGERRLKLIETVRVSQNLEVSLLALDGRDLVIAATPSGAVVLEAVSGDKSAQT